MYCNKEDQTFSKPNCNLPLMKTNTYWDLTNTSFTHRIVQVAPIQNLSDQSRESLEDGGSVCLSLTESEVGQSNFWARLSTTCWCEDSPWTVRSDSLSNLPETSPVLTWSNDSISTASPSPGASQLTPFTNRSQMTDDTISLDAPSSDWPVFLTWDPRSPLAGRSLLSLVDDDQTTPVVPFSKDDDRSLASPNPVEDICLNPINHPYMCNLARKIRQVHEWDVAITQEEKGKDEVKQSLSSQPEKNENSEVQVNQKKGKKTLRKRFLQWLLPKLGRKSV
ncbi:hypothetical protein DPEC_G00187520 [Dallia pectoralis]|uniref:Uncharacterized protein n=1 Tax=Dallia pectoralis TaxID=75939 RepID=A0ACC2GBQ0_DALPE|nr:hypothetical protein DPEC_G00187520 [Dallia pectoralis]